MAEPAGLEDVALVDDAFWLARAGDLVTGAPKLRTEAAKQLMSALSWLWTVYTGAAVLGAVTRSSSLPAGVGVLLALPSFLIVVAYAFAVVASMPLNVSFDPRDPDEVRLTYTGAVHRGWRRLQAALALCVLSALAIGVAIAAVAVSA
jgi:hypothetical protein